MRHTLLRLFRFASIPIFTGAILWLALSPWPGSFPPARIAHAQGTPNCQFTQSFTASGVGAIVQNGPTTSGGPQGCVAFRMVYWVQAGSGTVSALSVTIQGSSTSAGSYTALTPAAGGGSGLASTTNPVTSSPNGQNVTCCDYWPFIQINVGTMTVSSGSPILIVKVLGFAGTSAANGAGGGGGGGGLVPTVVPPSDASTKIANTQFVQNAVDLSMATIPLANITGGTYSYATLGAGAVVNFTASGGAITSINTIFAGGSGYAVGDLLTLGYTNSIHGNADAVLRVATVTGSAVASLTILYGGSGYLSGTNAASQPAYTIPFTFELAGVLASNATFIMPNGTPLLSSNQWIFANNTTGAFTVKVFVSNGSNATTGSGVTIPQGTGNIDSLLVWTDGSTDVWAAAPAANNPTVETLQVSQNGTASEISFLGGRFGINIPVPYFSPTAATQNIAFDVGPTVGATDFNGIAVAWADICDAISTCTLSPNAGYESLRTGIHANGVGFIGTAHGGIGTQHDLAIQPAAGNTIVGGLTEDATASLFEILGTTSNSGMIETGVFPTITGCGTISATAGGATAGTFTTNTTGTCAASFTMPTAPHGWSCFVQDITKHVVTNILIQTGSTVSSCAVTGTTAASDVLTFFAVGY
jgi:hypothetical protein